MENTSQFYLHIIIFIAHSFSTAIEISWHKW